MTSLLTLALLMVVLLGFLVLALVLLDVVEGSAAERPVRWAAAVLAVTLVVLVVGAADVPPA